ncbi:MAG: GTP cyclohydrolase, FolE2/MptA family [Ignisphaera sp.]
MLPDVQRSTPVVPLDIDKVCVKGVYRRVCLGGSGNSYCLDVKVDACIDLPKTQRGVHVSRSIEAVIKSFEESASGDVNRLEDYLKILAKNLLKSHEYALKASTSLKTVYLHRVRDDFVGVEDHIPVKIRIMVEVDRNGHQLNSISVEIKGMTVCPCVQQVYAFLENLQAPHVPSHSQRAKLIATVVSRGEKTIDIRRLVEAGLNAFSAPLYFMLKRVNEYRLVKKAFSTPRFVEDVVREAMYNIYKLCRDGLDKDARIVVKVVSYESIHPYNLYAEAGYTIEELRKIFEESNQKNSSLNL